MAASTQAKRPQQAPISSHPVFPAVVALWFAALFGIGSLVLPAPLLETLTANAGMGDSSPGVTTRITLALGAALVGVLAGLAIARRVVAAQAVATPARAPRVAPHKKPISAHEELGDEGLDAVGYAPAEPEARRHLVAGRRRALSVTEESGRSEFLEAAPLPGGLHIAPEEAPLEDPKESEQEDALELAAFVEEEPAGTVEEPREMVFGTGSLSVGKPAPSAMPIRDWAPAEAAAGQQGAPGRFDRPAHPLANAIIPGAIDEPAADTSDEFAEVAQPAAEDSPGAAVDAEIEVAAAVPFGMPEPVNSNPAPPDDVPGEVAAEFTRPLAERPLAELNMVELVERFALSLQNRTASLEARETPASASANEEAPIALPFAMPSRIEDEEAAPTPAKQAEVPVALQPVAFDEAEDDDDWSIDLSLEFDAAPRAFARPAEAGSEPPRFAPMAFDAEEDEGDDADEFDGEFDGGCSSLLDMKNAFGPREEFVRIEEDEPEEDAFEQIVVFPGQGRASPASDGSGRDMFGASAARPFDAPPAGEPFTGNAPAAPTAPPARRADPAQTEQALRDALVKLQKMSGAA